MPKLAGTGWLAKYLPCSSTSGLASAKALILSGLGFLVSGSGASDSSRPRNCSGVAAPNTGAEMLPICQVSPPGRSNCSAMLRWLLALSGAFGLPPPTENLAITGTGWPLKADALDKARPSALPTNSPIAHTPLAPERR